ncbi:MAG: chloride channel protein [Bdellovibrionota bacterium]
MKNNSQDDSNFQSRMKSHFTAEKMQHYGRLVMLSVACGLISGLAAAVFILLLQGVTGFYRSHLYLIWTLPFLGFAIGWMYHQFGRDVVQGKTLILEQIHDPKRIIPPALAPLVLISTLMTHLGGGSAGREGTAIQIGASLTDQLSQFFKVTAQERRYLLVAAFGASFGATIGAPWAGVIFGMEVINVGRIRFNAVAQCLIASFVAYFVTKILGVQHTMFGLVEGAEFSWMTMFWIALAGIAFGLTARLFAYATHVVEMLHRRWIPYSPLRPFLGGVIIAGFFFLEGSFRYTGLGLVEIQEAFMKISQIEEPIFKSLFTAVTLGSGFKGGEFMPLVFIGTTLGSALAVLIPVSFTLLAAVGFAAVFGGAANTPIACAIMAGELFGFEVFPYALIACVISYIFSGRRGIYKGQMPLSGYKFRGIYR